MKTKTRTSADRGYAAVRLVSIVFFLLFTIHCSLLTAKAQDDPTDSVPPPMKAISKNEQRSLDAENEPKLRTMLVLQLMSTRLASAEKLTTTKDFDAMYKDLGGFQYLMDDGLGFLLNRAPHDKKMLDHYKRFEIGLRAFMPRLEVIRRELPIEYDPYLGHLLKYVRIAREKVLDPMFSDTVVREKKN